MKYPVIYIKGRGDHTARFAELTGGKMRVVTDIRSAAQALTALHADHAVILYEQRDTETDSGNIRFLRSRFPGTGIILIASAPPERSGSASGMLATARLIGQTTGAALMALLFHIVPENSTHAALLLAGGFAVGAAAVSLARISLPLPEGLTRHK